MKFDNLIFVEEAMRFPEVVKLVRNASERIWYKVNDVTSFEHTCYRNIGIALVNENVRSVGGIATRIIARAEKWHIKNRGAEPLESIQSLAGLDEEGCEQPFEIKDVLANVESTVIDSQSVNEKIAFLAEGDSRKEFVLRHWTNGGYNDKELSNVLANVFGGKSSSHRRFIQRFRIECQKRLANAV